MGNNKTDQSTKKTKVPVSEIDRAKTSARLAVYDDLKAPPHVMEIKPAATNTFIENLSSSIYEEASKKGGKVPYTVIREISENFIHAGFKEIVVSVLDSGNTIRFTDQGPGFVDVNNAQLPGFTSATEQMKKYIRGVGSGLPTVKDYLTYSNGNIKIENNLDKGAVVTISMLENLKDSTAFSDIDKESSNAKYKEKMSKLTPSLNDREKQVLKLFMTEGPLGVSKIHELSNIPLSSVHKTLQDLEKKTLVEKTSNKKRILSDQGFAVTNLL